MDRIKLASHVKKGDTLYTPYTEPDGLGKALKITSWSKSWLPEFMWIGLIISELGRKQGLEQLYKIIDELQENKICVPYFSKIKGLDRVLWSSFFVTLRPNFCHRVYATP